MAQRTGRIGLLVAAAATVGALASGCGVVSKVKQTVHNVESNKATIDSFTQNLDSSQSVPFSATYTTSGSSPATVVYAVDPANNELAFHLTQTGANGTNVQIISNASGNYTCTQSGSSWSCDKLAKGSASAQQNIIDLYTPSHWVGFLKGVSLAAGLAGDKVSTSTMQVNGFNLQCVDLVATGVAGTSTICTTPQNILGYVKVASDATSFAITDYSSSPDPSLFQLPAGATVTTPTT
jgi:hypothetical protein